METKIKKPPLGLIPRWVHDSERVQDIFSAMKRYTNNNMTIPKSWIEELEDIYNIYLNFRGINNE